MRTSALLVFISFFSISILAQENEMFNTPMIGDSAPEFAAQSTQGVINFPEDFFGKWKILFSHPADFTPVCSTEILGLAEESDEFKKRNTQIVVMSTDRLGSHIAWVKSLESIQIPDRGPIKVNFPIVSDPDLHVSKMYGMIHPATSLTQNIRGVFVIDSEDIIRATMFYPSTTGRSLDELLRVIDALQLSDKKNILTPVNWKMGDDVLIPSPLSVEESKKLEEKKDPNLYSLEWYLWFKKSN
jgi:peroxiredoxin (alkyl hydroperoxide reductase subunit C)